MRLNAKNHSMKSMTGYGTSHAQTETCRIEVSLRSVNGRFFETRFHLPREFMPFESELRKTLGKYFERGTLDIFVSRKARTGQIEHRLVINKELAREYHKALKQLSKELKLKMSGSIESIYRLPEVMKLEEKELPIEHEKKALLKAMDEACRACTRERKREGETLHKELAGLVSRLEEQVKEIHSLREEANESLQRRYEEKLKGRAEELKMDTMRLTQEVVIQLEKSDIDEEVVRLREHCKHYRQILGTDESMGKRLDFYTQELLREVNTIGSKSSLSKLTQIVVEAKGIIEKLREQVQNVE